MPSFPSSASEPTSIPPEDMHWSCSSCTYNIRPNQARICVKCLPLEVGENSPTGLIIHDVKQAEEQLICGHCAIESNHKYHITMLYMPTKIRNFAHEKSGDLRRLIRRSAINESEQETIEDAITLLRETSSAETFDKCVRIWEEAESAITGMAAANRRINEYFSEIEHFTELIEEQNAKKQNLIARLTCAVGGVHMDSPPRSTESSPEAMNAAVRHRHEKSNDTDSDTTSSMISLRRFGVCEDLSSCTAE